MNKVRRKQEYHPLESLLREAYLHDIIHDYSVFNGHPAVQFEQDGYFVDLPDTSDQFEAWLFLTWNLK